MRRFTLSIRDLKELENLLNGILSTWMLLTVTNYLSWTLALRRGERSTLWSYFLFILCLISNLTFRYVHLNEKNLKKF